MGNYDPGQPSGIPARRRIATPRNSTCPGKCQTAGEIFIVTAIQFEDHRGYHAITATSGPVKAMKVAIHEIRDDRYGKDHCGDRSYMEVLLNWTLR